MVPKKVINDILNIIIMTFDEWADDKAFRMAAITRKKFSNKPLILDDNVLNITKVAEQVQEKLSIEMLCHLLIYWSNGDAEYQVKITSSRQYSKYDW